jgi:hypothetical protein
MTVRFSTESDVQPEEIAAAFSRRLVADARARVRSLVGLPLDASFR